MKSCLVCLALIAPAHLHAQTAAQVAPQPDVAARPRADGDAIVVSASRAPVAIERVPLSVTVLDKPAIDRAGDLAVADLLVRTPGVTQSRNGGYGALTYLRVRGAEADQTVVVVDGVKLNDPSAPGGGYDFGNLLTGDATRIEVLRGPQSILWGSQAIGGVINVVTPLPTRALEGSFDLEGGSRDTVSGRAGLGGRSGPLAWRLGAQAFTTDGISAQANGTERDGYRNRTATGRALLDLADGLSAELRGSFIDARVELDGFAGDSDEYALTRQFVGYAGLNLDLAGGRFRNRLGYGYTNIDRDNVDPTSAPATTFDSTGRNERLEYQGSVAIVRGIDAVFGAEDEISRYRTESPAFGIPLARARAEIASAYGQLSAGVGAGLTLTAGLRHDDHSRFGGQTLAAGGAAWALPGGTLLRASYAEGFKAPTLFQLFSEFGNAGLAPERADGWEAGVEQRLAGGRATLAGTYYERRSRDLIGFFSCSATSADPLCLVPGSATQRRFGYYQNVARAVARGIEAVGRVSLGERLTLDGNYSWMLSEDRSGGANDGRQLARRPRHAANLAATYAVPAGPSVGAALRWSGEAFEDNRNTLRLAPYTLVDLRAELPIAPTATLFARAENLLDERYQTARGFGTLGRSIYAGLRGRF